jgi:Protein of unknown function VcgC/VcgE (DUF2780)
MTRRGLLGLASLVLLTLPVAAAPARDDGRAQGAAKAATAAAQASPDLVQALSKEIGATPEQAAGAAGSLFSVAKSRLSPADFSQVANAVPGMDSLLGAAPAGGQSALSQVAGTAGGLATAASSFTKLGLKPEMVAKAVPVLTSFVTKSGGANVGSLLAGVLK